MNTPNKITVGRIILVPVFLVLLYLDFPYWALAVYIIACMSDLIDGRIARKYNLVTDFGKFMDPLADKMRSAFSSSRHSPGSPLRRSLQSYAGC